MTLAAFSIRRFMQILCLVLLRILGLSQQAHAPSLMSESIQIGEVSKRAGITIDAVRYYEKRRLIHSVSPTRGGFCLFKSQTVEQLNHSAPEVQRFENGLKVLHQSSRMNLSFS